MSSILSTQNRQTFFRRKYCFLPVAIALSPPVGRCEAAIGRPPFCSGMIIFLVKIPSGAYCGLSAGAGDAAVAGAPGMGDPGSAGKDGALGGGAEGAARLRAARLSRALLRFSIRFNFSSMRTVMNF